MPDLKITAVTPEGGKLSLPATDHGYSRKFITEPGLYFELEGGAFFVPASLLRAKLAELPHLEAPAPAPLLPAVAPPPTPVPTTPLLKRAMRKPVKKTKRRR
jgi:hypothetical protein